MQWREGTATAGSWGQCVLKQVGEQRRVRLFVNGPILMLVPIVIRTRVLLLLLHISTAHLLHVYCGI